MTVTRRDLVAHAEGGAAFKPKPFLFCEKCQNRYSATPGDYFMMAPDDVFTCCGEAMVLATETTTISKI